MYITTSRESVYRASGKKQCKDKFVLVFMNHALETYKQGRERAKNA
jgi:hypothetical protein